MINKRKVLLVCSPYYKNITDNLIEGASHILKSNSIEYKILYVPGALEIAPAIKLVFDKSLKNPLFDGFIALGCVIKGETYHFEIVANESSRTLSDLCLNQPNSVVEWMRNGTWTKTKNYGEGNKKKPGFPLQPSWFLDARGFNNLEKGLNEIGFSKEEVNSILGNNWYNFYKGII